MAGDMASEKVVTPYGLFAEYSPSDAPAARPAVCPRSRRSGGGRRRWCASRARTSSRPTAARSTIKGISLGNWLMPEGYMFKFEVAKAPRQIFGAFERLLGPERAAALLDQYRDTYITQDDIRFIKSVGFNTVRIPLHYRLFMTEDGDDRRRGLGAARPRAGLGARRRALRHRRPARRAGRPDRHQPRRRAGLSADVLRAARPRRSRSSCGAPSPNAMAAIRRSWATTS